MKLTQATLDKLEKIATESGYVIRYERGSFLSGYCILQEKKVVVLNKFLPIDGRINTMIDLIPQLNIGIDLLTNESQKLFLSLMPITTPLPINGSQGRVPILFFVLFSSKAWRLDNVREFTLRLLLKLETA